MSVATREGMVAPSLSDRIDRMHNRDRIGATAFVVGLWFVLLFVLFSIWPEIENGTIKTILVISGAGVLALNTAAIVAMLRHYHHDKQFIYSLDLKHLDEMRKRRG